METKVCNKCGRELPISEYYLLNGKPRHLCKECYLKVQRERKNLPTPSTAIKDAPKVATEIVKECDNIGLDKVPARLLISELRRRGYRGELELVTIQKVVI